MKDFILRHKKLSITLLVIAAIIVGTALHMYIARPQLSRLPSPPLRVYFWLNGYTIPLRMSGADIRKSLAIVEKDERISSYYSEDDCEFYRIVYDYYGWEYRCRCGKHHTE